MQKSLFFLFIIFPAFIFPVYAQDDPEIPPLTETFSGSGRLADITLSHPEGWFTLGGIPVNRFISFNLLSSVQIGLRNRVEPGQEAIVFAIAGGRINGWNELTPDSTPEEVLDAFFSRLGDGGDFAPEDDPSRDGEFELLSEAVEFGGYEGVRLRFVEVAIDEANPPEPEAAANDEAEAEFVGEFIAYALLLEDNRFMVVLVLTSELNYDEASPLIDSILDSITYAP